MTTYIIRRLLLMIPTLLGMTFMLFAVVRFAPGLTTAGGQFSAGVMQSRQAQKQEQEIMERRLHLVDKNGHPISLPMQYILWLTSTCEGHLGTSVVYQEPVLTLIEQRLPVTLTINAIALMVIYLVSIPGGLLTALYQGRLLDRGYGFFSLALYSLPVIWVGSTLLGFLANPQYFNWFPSAGLHATNTESMTFFRYLGDYFYHIVLPIVCLVYSGFAFLSKQIRGSILENLQQDYVRTARAKGLPKSTVLLRHVFRNSLLNLITLTGMSLPGLLSGSVIVEQIFSINGMGRLAYSSTLASDLPVIQDLALIMGVLTLLSYLAVDICYHIADPRVTYD
ncbi:MAG: ABC transporter permease [Phycisphaerae bacterium]